MSHFDVKPLAETHHQASVTTPTVVSITIRGFIEAHHSNDASFSESNWHAEKLVDDAGPAGTVEDCPETIQKLIELGPIDLEKQDRRCRCIMISEKWSMLSDIFRRGGKNASFTHLTFSSSTRHCGDGEDFEIPIILELWRLIHANKDHGSNHLQLLLVQAIEKCNGCGTVFTIHASAVQRKGEKDKEQDMRKPLQGPEHQGKAKYPEGKRLQLDLHNPIRDAGSLHPNQLTQPELPILYAEI